MFTVIIDSSKRRPTMTFLRQLANPVFHPWPMLPPSYAARRWRTLIFACLPTLPKPADRWHLPVSRYPPPSPPAVISQLPGPVDCGDVKSSIGFFPWSRCGKPLSTLQEIYVKKVNSFWKGEAASESQRGYRWFLRSFFFKGACYAVWKKHWPWLPTPLVFRFIGTYLIVAPLEKGDWEGRGWDGVGWESWKRLKGLGPYFLASGTCSMYFFF